MSNDPRRQKPVTIEWWHDKVGRLLIDGVLWGGVEWSEKRGAWCIEDAEGRYLSHRSHVGGEDEDKAGAIALAEAMIRDGRMPSPEDARKRAKRAPVTTGNNVPERAADPAKQSSRHLRPRTAEEIANEQTAEQLALRIWAAMVAQKVLSGMSALMDELIQSHLLDDDDEEADEGWLDDHHKREKKILDEAIADGLDKYPDFDAINNLPPNSDPDIARDAEQLKDVLTKCAIGATEFKEKFSRAQLERMVKRDLETRFKKDPKYSKHVREDVPGSDVKAYGSRGRTSSKGTFAKAADYESGGGLAALFTGGWMRVAKDRIDPVAWSHQFDFSGKLKNKNWRHHFLITERNGKQSAFELPREKLAGTGASAIRLLMKAGIHVVGRDVAQKALVQFLRFKPRREIIRMPRVGWAEVGSHWMIFVRPDEVIMPPGMPQAARHELCARCEPRPGTGCTSQGTAAEWAAEVAAPLARQFQRRPIVRDVLRGAVVAFCERAGRRQSSLWAFDHRQDDGVGCRAIDLRLAA